MTELRNGVYATPTEELSALALEARRRGISYGHLVANTTPYEQQEIIRDYCEEKACPYRLFIDCPIWLAWAEEKNIAEREDDAL